MKTIEEIILDYTKGEKDLPETNEALKEAGSNTASNQFNYIGCRLQKLP